MTTYNRSERHAWRYPLRRFAWRLNLALACVALLVILLPAQTGARSCGVGYTRIAHGCRAANLRTLRCDPGYYGQWSRDSGRPVGYCVAGPVVQR